jgi:lipoyl(octanoyl) transferase
MAITDINTDALAVRHLGLQDYETVWHAMSDFTDLRDDNTPDELWLVQHPPVFTQGQAGKAEHILMPGDIPVVQVDRGGQVTYHGPGQLVGYPMINLRRRKLGIRELVSATENSIVDTLADIGIKAYPKADAPGVYVDRDGVSDKIASLGFRVRRGCSFHGLSLNVDMDLSPWQRINPCGYSELLMTQIKALTDDPAALNMETLEAGLVKHFCKHLDFNSVNWIEEPTSVLSKAS